MTMPAEGTKLQIESATPGTYTDIGGIEAVTPPSTTVGEVKKTTLQSTRQEYRPGKIPDSGTLQFRIQYDPDSTAQQDLEDALDAGTTKNWKLIWADGMATPANEGFAGFLTSFAKSELADETNALADVTIRVTGTVTRTAGSA